MAQVGKEMEMSIEEDEMKTEWRRGKEKADDMSIRKRKKKWRWSD